jgi:hypothetical protein
MKKTIFHVLLAVFCGLIPYAIYQFNSDQEAMPPSAHDLAEKAFKNAHSQAAMALWKSKGIPPSISLGVAALTSDFGYDEAIVNGNRFFLITEDSLAGTVRAYTNLDSAYQDWGVYVSKQKNYSSVKGKPAYAWYSMMDSLGYGVEIIHDIAPNLQTSDTLCQ